MQECPKRLSDPAHHKGIKRQGVGLACAGCHRPLVTRYFAEITEEAFDAIEQAMKPPVTSPTPHG